MNDVVIRSLPLAPQHLPVAIYDRNGEPLPATTALIVHHSDDSPARERFVLTLLDSGGSWLEGLPYDTLDIALDQAYATLGIKPQEWRVVSRPYDRS